jgi:peptide/nickel transport system ATP-binding protein
MSLLEVRNLSVSFGEHRVVRNVSFSLEPGELLGMIGESGSGKSLSMLAVMGLLPDGATVSGSVLFNNEELLKRSDAEMSWFRGKHIGMVFQDPLASLNPLMTIGKQVAQPLINHKIASRKAARLRATELCSLVGLSEPQRMVESYPHQLSGGQRQRVGLAIALACSPSLLIADEPTTALDVTVQQEVLQAIRSLAAAQGTSLIFVSHDLPVVTSMVRRVLVLHEGTVVENTSKDELLRAPQHPHTQRIVASAKHSSEQLRQIIQTSSR